MAQILANPRSYKITKAFEDFVSAQEELRDHYLFQSSGSTGNPKWVALSAAALEASAKAVNKHLEVTSKDVFALSLPTFHVGGFGIVERARVASARVEEYRQKWSAVDFTKWVADARVSIGSLVPAQIYDLVQSKQKAPASLRAIVVGGGALPQNLYFDARALGWPLLISYGLTECASQVATAELSSLHSARDEKLWPRARILSHIEATQISEGRVSVKSPALFTAYLVEHGGTFSLLNPKESASFVLPDRVDIKDDSLVVSGRWEQDYKILGEWIRWDYLKKFFAELCVEKKLFMKIEIEIFFDERNGNKIAVLTEKFDQAEREVIESFNAKVFPFERITHYYEGNLPRSELGKILKLKINPICLKEISR